MTGISFANPAYLYLLAIIPLLVIWYVYFHNKLQPRLLIPAVEPVTRLPAGFRTHFRHFPFGLRMVTLVLLIVILARPQSVNRWENESVEGIDIMLVMDISGSMLAADFSPNRIEAAKTVATEFIAGRSNDRMGLVLFSGESFTQCPLTTDHAALMNLLQQANVGVIENQTTAIGLGLANAVKRLKDSEAKSRVVILVTDGVNNAGSVDPLTAAEIARTFGIRVYTIGVGTHGTAPFPVRNFFGDVFYQQQEVEIDEAMLRKISGMTNGAYFRATGNQKLREIYSEIDKLEKSKIFVRQFSRRHDEYRPLALAVLVLLALEVGIRVFILKSIT